jgi:hypothetical protein
MHVVTAWLGNTPTVAMKHYLMTTEEHFASALEGGAESGALSAQKAAQPIRATNSEDSHEPSEALAKGAVMRLSAIHNVLSHKDLVEDRGLEPLTF